MRISLLLLLCALLFPATQAKAVVVIAAEIPYVIRSYQGAPSGMAIEVLEEAARRLKEPLTIELMPLARALSQTRHRQDVLLVPPVRSPSASRSFCGLHRCWTRPSCWSAIASTILPPSPAKSCPASPLA